MRGNKNPLVVPATSSCAEASAAGVPIATPWLIPLMVHASEITAMHQVILRKL
jgi:hypothetical protein